MLLQKKLKIIPEKSFFRASHCKTFWSRSLIYITTTQSKTAAIQKMPSLNTKIDLRKLIVQ